MSKRQSDYLNSLLAPTEPLTVPAELQAEAPSPPPVLEAPAPRGMTLLGRESALARIATGEVRQVTQLMLDPSRVRIWRGNARRQDALSEDSCRDLIDSILAEGGQKVPAIVRRVSDDADFDYEVIAGTRRHWAISWLRANNYPEMTFLAQVHTLDDESAFRLADVENRARRDVSDFERACNYREALESYYANRQNRMAERLNLSKGWLSKMLTVAALPDWAVKAFADPTDIQLKAAYPLAQKIITLTAKETRDVAMEKAMIATAKRLSTEQARRRSRGEEPIAAAEVITALMHPDRDGKEPAVLFVGDSAHGRLALSVLSSNRNGVTVRLHAGSGANEAELAQLLRRALTALQEQGRGLQP